MPDLPTLTVTTAQATRIQNAFPGATTAEKAEAYRAWLRDAISGYVKATERQVLLDRFETEMATSETAVDTDLGSL